LTLTGDYTNYDSPRTLAGVVGVMAMFHQLASNDAKAGVSVIVVANCDTAMK